MVGPPKLKYYNLGEINLLQKTFYERIYEYNRDKSRAMYMNFYICTRASITVAIETRDNIDPVIRTDENHCHRYLSNLGKLHHMNQHYSNIVQNMPSSIFVNMNV